MEAERFVYSAIPPLYVANPVREALTEPDGLRMPGEDRLFERTRPHGTPTGWLTRMTQFVEEVASMPAALLKPHGLERIPLDVLARMYRHGQLHLLCDSAQRLTEDA